MVSKRPTRKRDNVRLVEKIPETPAQRIVRVTETFYETQQTAGNVALSDPVTNQQAKASPFDSTFGNAAYGNGYGQPSGRPIPEIPPVSPTRPPMLDYGATGTSFFSGLLQNDEYNPEFYWRDAILKFEQMRRNDPQVIAQEMMLTLPILAAQWKIEPASDDPRDVEIASFVETCLLEGMTYTSRSGVVIHQTFHDILKHALLLFAYGFSAFELCFKIEDGWVKWSRWLPLLPRTVWRWWVDEDNELVGIQQWSYRDYSYRFVDIPAGKLLVLTHRQEGQNYEGVSVLRTAFKPWWFKQNFEKILAVAIERTGIEVPVITVGPTPSDSDVQAALTILQNVRANEYMGAVIPHDWEFGYPKLYANHAEAILPALQYMDTMIARNVLCQFLDLGSTETGAYNLDASQKQTFLMSLQATCEYLASRFQGPIQQLVDYNYDDVAIYPKLTCSKLVSQDMVTLGQVLQQIPNYVPATPAVQKYITDLVGLPSEVDPVEGTNPTDPNQPGRPDDVTGNAQSQDHTTQQAGVARSNPSGTGAGGRADMDISGGDDQGDNTEAAVAGQMRSVEPVDTRLLNEALAAIYGRDATMRGERHLARATEVDESMVLYNPYHDEHGRFTSGGGGATSTVAKGQGRTIRGEGGKRSANPAHPANNSGMSDEHFHAALLKSYTERADSTGVASIRAVRNDVMRETGISRAEFDNRLLGMQSLPEGHSGLGAHLEPSDDYPSSRFGIRGSNTENYSFMSLHSNGSFLTGNAPDGTPYDNVRGRKLSEPSDLSMCDCDPGTLASECSCDAGCMCRADGGSCPEVEA